MNINYNILWVENEPEWYKDTKESVEYILKEEGFKLKCTYKSTMKEIDELFLRNGLKNFDLILIDLSLNNGERGNTIIEYIRTNKVFTEVFFYSQNIEEVKNTIRNNELEGVYISKRDRVDFENKFEIVFKTTIKKVQDVSAIRGLVMAETSKLDRKIESIILKFCSCANPDMKDKILNYIKDKLVSSTKSSFKKADKLIGATDIDTIINERIFDSYKKVHAVGEIIEISGKLKHIKKCDFVDGYVEDVIELRNILAHVEEFETEDGKTCLKTHKGDITIGDEECKKFRDRIIKQDEILNQVMESVCEEVFK